MTYETHPDTVLAFAPNKNEPLHFVAEYGERDDMYGRTITGPQCEVCGRSDEYVIERNGLMPKFGAIRCGCGQRYRVSHEPADSVVFPS